jgi:hypothetical protein
MLACNQRKIFEEKLVDWTAMVIYEHECILLTFKLSPWFIFLQKKTAKKKISKFYQKQI